MSGLGAQIIISLILVTQFVRVQCDLCATKESAK